MLKNGVDLRLDGYPVSMHHKVFIIDERIVVTSSFNFSNIVKTRNVENTLIIHDLEIATLYIEEGEWVWFKSANKSLNRNGSVLIRFFL